MAKAHTPTPSELLAKSDAVYYSPKAHGITDLAVEIVIDQLASHPVARQAAMTYFFAGEDRQRFDVANLPETETDLRNEILALVSPYAEYLMPRPSSETFQGLTMKAERVSTQIAGFPYTTYVQLSGASPDEKAAVKEYRVLLDEHGLAYQVENVLQDGSTVTARVDNVQIGNDWHIAKITTRLPGKTGTQWKVDRIEYETVKGYPLPSRLTTTYRDMFDRPVSGLADLTVTFRNYRINEGIAATAVPAPAQPATAPQPATTP